jgi:hypothetical protein
VFCRRLLHPDHEVARQCLGNVLSGDLAPERPHLLEAERADAIKLDLERDRSRRFHQLPAIEPRSWPRPPGPARCR